MTQEYEAFISISIIKKAGSTAHHNASSLICSINYLLYIRISSHFGR